MTTPATAGTSQDCSERRPSPPRRQDGQFRRLGYAVEYSGILVRASGGAHPRRTIRRQPHGRNRNPRPERAAIWSSTSPATTPRNSPIGQAHYSGLMTARGTFVDDLLVHKISDTHYLLCVNAGNQDRDFEHIVANNQFDAKVENAGAALFAARDSGPAAPLSILQRLTPAPLDAIRYYHFTFGKVERRRLPDRAHRLHRRRRLRNLFRPGTFRKTLERSAGSRRLALA